MRGVHDMRAHLADPWVVGCYLHTHSFDRRLDHADYYPFYAACADAGVPVQMQAGTSGGLMASECGRPITHRPRRALLPRHEVRAVAPRLAVGRRGDRARAEVPERATSAPARCRLGTGRRRCCSSCAAPAAPRCCSRTNFPTVGHRHALDQIAELELTPEIEQALLGGTARPGLHPPRKESPHDESMIGKVYGIPPQPPVEENTRTFPAGAVTLRRRVPRPRSRESRGDLQGQPRVPRRDAREVTRRRLLRRGRLHPRVRRDDGHEYLRFDVFDDEPHYHYIHRTVDDTVVNNVIDFDTVAHGDMLAWTLRLLHTRLPEMLRAAGGDRVAAAVVDIVARGRRRGRRGSPTRSRFMK